MFNINFIKNLRFAALLLLSLTMVFSCQSIHELDARDENPELAFDIPTGSTPCNEIEMTFNTTHTVQSARGGSSYHFTVKVLRSTQCDLAGLSGSSCQHIGDSYALNINPNFGLNYSQFSQIQAVNLNGTEIPYYINPEGTMLKCNEAFTARFTWSSNNLSNPTPSVDRFNSGGVCIIGIIQDPNGGGNSNG